MWEGIFCSSKSGPFHPTSFTPATQLIQGKAIPTAFGGFYFISSLQLKSVFREDSASVMSFPEDASAADASQEWFTLLLLTPLLLVELTLTPSLREIIEAKHLQGVFFLMMATPSLPFPHSNHQMRLQPLFPILLPLSRYYVQCPFPASTAFSTAGLFFLESFPLLGIQDTGLSFYLDVASFSVSSVGSHSLLDPFSSPSPPSQEVTCLAPWLNTIYIFNVCM